jgi:four helix bundle protein
MGAIRRFEDLIAWQEARRLHQGIAVLCRKPAMRVQFKLVDQLLSASRSIGANIAEGFERFTPGEFGHFLYIAKGSAGEVRSLLTNAFDEGRVEAEEFQRLSAQSESVGRIVGALRASIARRRRPPP